MITYVYEVAPWCKSNMHDPEEIKIFGGLPDTDPEYQIGADQVAIAAVIQDHLLKDRDAWSQLPEELANAAWDDDGRTVAAWNVTGPRGTYQVRLARAVSS